LPNSWRAYVLAIVPTTGPTPVNPIALLVFISMALIGSWIIAGRKPAEVELRRAHAAVARSPRRGRRLADCTRELRVSHV
jgi:hypothetical protein